MRRRWHPDAAHHSVRRMSRSTSGRTTSLGHLMRVLAMKTLSKLILFSAIFILSIAGQFAQAQTRDAGAKARGDYSFLPGASAQLFAAPARAYYAPAAASTAATATPSRSYSYGATTAEPSCGATTSDMPGMSLQPARASRTFSYAPAEPVRPRARAVAPFGYSGGVRNAASKALGQY
jgi:hypothetical protein